MSLSLFVLALDKLTVDELRDETRPRDVSEIIRDYPVSGAEKHNQSRPLPPAKVFFPTKSSKNLEIDDDRSETASGLPKIVGNSALDRKRIPKRL